MNRTDQTLCGDEIGLIVEVTVFNAELFPALGLPPTL